MAKKQVVKVTLSSTKVVIMRKPRISDTELAAQEVSKRAGGDGTLLQILMQKALLKNLLVQVDGKDLTAAEKEGLDDLLEIEEYSQLLQVIHQMTGGDNTGKLPALEIVNSGDK